MKNSLRIILILFCYLNAFGQQTVKDSDTNKSKNQSPQPQTSTTSNNTVPVSGEEYRVYAVVLRKVKGTLIIKDKTDVDKDSKDIKMLEKRGLEPFLKKIESEAMADFLAKNETHSTLEKKFPPDIEFNFISNEELKANFAYKFDGEMNWESFREKYPKAGNIYTLSNVGFSEDSNQALVFVTNWCGYTCGEGNYYILKKLNGEWEVVDSLMTWIS